MIAACITLGLASTAHAVPRTYRNDQFDDNIRQAAAQMQGVPLATQPGFEATEAFGIMIRPTPDQYPISLQGIDVVLAAPPNLPEAGLFAQFEVYASESGGPDPASNPIFTINTAEMIDPANPDGDGLQLRGNTANVIDFNWQDAEGHPPEIFAGNIWVVMRYTSGARDMSADWGTAQCMREPELGMCGCQNVGALLDPATTDQVNVMAIIWPPGNCVGGSQWTWAEDIGVTGDLVFRVRADTGGQAPCTPHCEGRVCGSDGCDGTCGPGCAGGLVCSAGGQCVEPPCQPVCAGRSCGDDGCGALCPPGCPEGEVCDAAGHCFDPAACVPQCEDKECGDDGCDGLCPPGCDVGFMCRDGACVDPAACVPQCQNKECGDDGCDGLCPPGCGEGLVCSAAGLCEPPGCVPQCEGKECGDDGCGADCGPCAAGSTCGPTGQCVADEADAAPLTPDAALPPPDAAPLPMDAAPVYHEAGVEVGDVTVAAVSPSSICAGEGETLTLTGAGFAPGAAARLGPRALASQVAGDGLMTAELPADVEAAVYVVSVVNLDGTTGFKEAAFEVKDCAGGGGIGDSGCGCRAGGGASPGPAGLLVLLAGALGVLVRRRRR